MEGGRSADDPVCPYSKARDAFFTFDTDADGTISGTEATLAARSCGLSFVDGGVPEDFNGPEVSFEAFEAFVTAELARKQPEVDFKKAFEALDKQKTGRISTAELKEILKVCGTVLDHAAIDELIKTADKDNTGFVDYNKFAAFLLK
eukprot:XP_023973938.1 calmodulin-like [Physeter catodon]